MKYERIRRNIVGAVGRGGGGLSRSCGRADQHPLFVVILPVPVQLARRADTAQRAGRDVRVRKARGTGHAGRTGLGLQAVRVETGAVLRSAAVLTADATADHDHHDHHDYHEAVHFSATVHPAEPVLPRRGVQHDFRSATGETGLRPSGTQTARQRARTAIPFRTAAQVPAAADIPAAGHLLRAEVRSAGSPENRSAGQRKRHIRRRPAEAGRPQVPRANAAAAIPPSVQRADDRELRQAPCGADHADAGHVDRPRTSGGDPAERDRRHIAGSGGRAAIQTRLRTQTAA